MFGCDASGVAGPAGPAGADGADGETGPAGPTGPAGSVDTATIWRTEDSGTTQQIRGVRFANGKWIAVGAAGTILTSETGFEWTAVVDTKNTASTADDTNWTTRTLADIDWGNGTWVAAATSGNTLLISTDNGTTWTTSTGGIQATHVHYANDLWVAVGSGGGIATSADDGANWTTQTSGVTPHLWAVTYGNSLWVVVGDDTTLLTSDDGTTWTAQTVTGVPSNREILYRGLYYGDGRFIATGANRAAPAGGTLLGYGRTTSTDGTTWTSEVSDTGTGAAGEHIEPIFYDNGIWINGGSMGTIMTSTNGTEWTTGRSGTANSLNGFDYDLIWVAVGNGGTILTAP